MCEPNNHDERHFHVNGRAHSYPNDHHRHTHHDDCEHPAGDRDQSSRVRIERDVLARNNRAADYNRGWLSGRDVLALNLVSSPGAGKTTLLEHTVRTLARDFPVAVIEGDQETDCDAQRIRASGCRAVQINTGVACHLDATMVTRALGELNPQPGTVLFIENVGNLVCPAMFDLGERAKIVVCSVPEGDDKPLKYPHMFRAGRVVILNKIDLLPHVPFHLDKFCAAVHRLNPTARVMLLSALRGEGLDEWYGWVREQRTVAQPMSL